MEITYTKIDPLHVQVLIQEKCATGNIALDNLPMMYSRFLSNVPIICNYQKLLPNSYGYWRVRISLATPSKQEAKCLINSYFQSR